MDTLIINYFHSHLFRTIINVRYKKKPYMIDPNTNMNGEEFEAYNIRRWGLVGQFFNTIGAYCGCEFY